MEVWPRLEDVKVFGYGQLVNRRMVVVEEVEEEDGSDEEFVDLPVMIVRAMELVKMKMSLMWTTDVVRLFEVVELGLGC